MPLFFHLYDGNQTDSTAHIPNWDSLREFLGQEDFLYIADSKLATKEALAHIANGGGRFISLLPATRSETSDFSSRLLRFPVVRTNVILGIAKCCYFAIFGISHEV